MPAGVGLLPIAEWGLGLQTAAAMGASSVVGAVASKMLAPKMPAMPPSPAMSQATVDQDTQNAENASRQRMAGSQGILSTMGTSGQGAGAMLNPSSISGKTLLGQ